MTNYTGSGFCRDIVADGTVFIGTRTGDDFNGIGTIKRCADHGGWIYHGEI